MFGTKQLYVYWPFPNRQFSVHVLGVFKSVLLFLSCQATLGLQPCYLPWPLLSSPPLTCNLGQMDVCCGKKYLWSQVEKLKVSLSFSFQRTCQVSWQLPRSALKALRRQVFGGHERATGGPVLWDECTPQIQGFKQTIYFIGVALWCVILQAGGNSLLLHVLLDLQSRKSDASDAQLDCSGQPSSEFSWDTPFDWGSFCQELRHVSTSIIIYLCQCNALFSGCNINLSSRWRLKTPLELLGPLENLNSQAGSEVLTFVTGQQMVGMTIAGGIAEAKLFC